MYYNSVTAVTQSIPKSDPNFHIVVEFQGASLGSHVVGATLTLYY